jgi:hypothetical protein
MCGDRDKRRLTWGGVALMEGALSGPGLSGLKLFNSLAQAAPCRNTIPGLRPRAREIFRKAGSVLRRFFLGDSKLRFGAGKTNVCRMRYADH